MFTSEYHQKKYPIQDPSLVMLLIIPSQNVTGLSKFMLDILDIKLDILLLFIHVRCMDSSELQNV